MNRTAQDEITDYVERVRAALSDLPDTTRDELLEDLPEHLAEIRAEDTVTLTDRLGTPESYAAELRATAAGYVGGFPDPPQQRWEPLLEMRDNALQVLGRADVKIGPVIGYVKASDFLVLLRPAWWVLRGYLAAMAIAYLFDSSSQAPGLLPRIGGSTIIALVLLAACVIGSIVLGRRRLQLARGPRYALFGGTAVLVLFALIGFSTADGDVRDPSYSGVGYSGGGNPYDNVGDVFVYDANGKLVPGARLFDQEGSPIQLGNPWCNDETTGESYHSRNMGYPYCPESAPFGSPSPRASFLDSTDPDALPTPDEAPSAPSVSPSVTPPPTPPKPSPSR